MVTVSDSAISLQILKIQRGRSPPPKKNVQGGAPLTAPPPEYVPGRIEDIYTVLFVIQHFSSDPPISGNSGNIHTAGALISKKHVIVGAK